MHFLKSYFELDCFLQKEISKKLSKKLSKYKWDSANQTSVSWGPDLSFVFEPSYLFAISKSRQSSMTKHIICAYLVVKTILYITVIYIDRVRLKYNFYKCCVHNCCNHKPRINNCCKHMTVTNFFMSVTYLTV